MQGERTADRGGFWPVKNNVFCGGRIRTCDLWVMSQAGIDFLASNTRTLAQPPDVFVLDPEHNMYFFVEVKRERDRLRATQVQLFKEIEKRFHCQVLVVNLKAA